MCRNNLRRFRENRAVPVRSLATSCTAGPPGCPVSDGVRAPGRDEAAESIAPSLSELRFVKGRPGSVTLLRRAHGAARLKIETPVRVRLSP